MTQDTLAGVIDAAVGAVVDNADELTSLDRAVGDGDHGGNMKRGFEAIAALRDELAAMEPGAALQKAGMTLVSKVGGASGPLYGSLLVSMGKARAAGSGWIESFAEGVAAVQRRGKSDVGAKTMLDVLVPALDALRANPAMPEGLAAMREAAARGREATKGMVATRGRASFLGERSRGHVDPGATSAALLIDAVCGALLEAEP